MSDEYTSRKHPHRLDPEDYRRPGQPCHIVLCTKDRRPFLVEEGVPGLLVDAMDTGAELNGCEIMAYCIMPNHLHLFVRVGPSGGDILDFIHSFKTWTGRQLKLRGYVSPAWQRSCHDRHARCDSNVVAAIAYMMENPLRAGLCRKVEEWPWSEFRLRIRGNAVRCTDGNG